MIETYVGQASRLPTERVSASKAPAYAVLGRRDALPYFSRGREIKRSAGRRQKIPRWCFRRLGRLTRTLFRMTFSVWRCFAAGSGQPA